MKIHPVSPNYIKPEFKETDYVFGSSNLPKDILREDGDWRGFIPVPENQYKNGFDTVACTIFNTIHAICTIQEEKYGIKDENYSERWISILSNNTKAGNDPIRVAQAIRDYGLIPDSMLPFDETITSWEEYNSFKGGSERACYAAGQQWLKRWNFGYERVWNGDIPPELKIEKIKQTLTLSPVGAAVFAWIENDGVFVKPQGEFDNHWTMITYVNKDNNPMADDSYDPFEKTLEKNYDFSLAIRYHVDKIETPEKLTFWQMIKKIFKIQ